MALSREEFKKYRVTKRPYPFDFERKQKVMQAMYDNGISTLAELAKKTMVNYKVLHEVINGTRRSPVNEQRIAAFFNMQPQALFPPRCEFDIAEMNKKAKERKQGAA